MKSFLPALLLAFATTACSHHDPAPATPTPPDPSVAAADDPETDPNVPAVDPTMPSWSPRSCNAYHVAVLHILDCDQIEPTKRAQIKAQYDLDHATWQAMHDEPLDAIAQVRDACKASWRSLHDQYTAAQCIPQAQHPTASTP